MYKIVRKKELNPTVTQMEIEAPLVAKKAKPGQFIILRVDAEGERIPLTVAGCNLEDGTVKIIFQIVGSTTAKLNHKQEGEYIEDFVGPLGRATETEGIKKVCIVGGGVGCAIALPVAQEFHRLGVEVTSIVGFRSKDIVILEDEFKANSTKCVMMTDDGSYGIHGFVSDVLKQHLDEFTSVCACGPKPMLHALADIAEAKGIPCQVSMEERMGCGIGACLVCVCSLKNKDGSTRYGHVCKDGPVFDSKEVQW